jgi:hypothetical protein
VIIKL